MTGVAVSREWSNYLKTPWVNNVKSDRIGLVAARRLVQRFG